MERSQYLAQAIQALSAQPQAGMAPIDVTGMAQQAQAGKAWEAANPGKSYLMHGINSAGQNLMALPGRIGGLFSLGQAAGG